MSDEARPDFDGKAVMITGGGSGIGAGIAEAFARAHADVFISGRREAPLAVMADRFPGRVRYIQMDLRSSEDRRRAVETIVSRTGRLDVLINNAATSTVGSLASLDSESILSMFDVLLASPAALMQLAIPHLCRSQGSIINISSVVGRFNPYPSRDICIYSSAKAGLNQLTKALAGELGPKGVRVNAIAPGPIAAGLLASDFGDGSSGVVDERIRSALQPYINETPMGRLGTPKDIASVALFLASAASCWVTGQIIEVSGGWGL